MIELIRQSAVPMPIMRSAALGALSLPATEIFEILVFLTRNPIFGNQARLTLAGWDPEAARAVVADPHAPREVLDYFMAAQNRRPALIPALLENPAIEEPALLDLAQADSREIIEMMLASARVRRSANVLHALLANPHVTSDEAGQVRAAVTLLSSAKHEADVDDMLGAGPTPYELEHAAEIAAEAGRLFEWVDASAEEAAELAHAGRAHPRPGAARTPAAHEHTSPLQKIARLTVGERVQLAMKGSKDERAILIRDGSKVVSTAVLESPKVNESEVEAFAAMKNVHESVLRGIAGKRKFMKNYAVVRSLVNNPRCPLDLSLALIKNLLVNDLKNLSLNKNVPDTIRKVAAKLFREKTTPGKREE